MSHESDELVLWVDNTEPIYRQKMYIFRALAKKKAKDIYDPKLAPKAFFALLNVAAKDYCREVGDPRDKWNLVFSPIARREAAQELAEQFLGWYESDYRVELDRGAPQRGRRRGRSS